MANRKEGMHARLPKNILVNVIIVCYFTTSATQIRWPKCFELRYYSQTRTPSIMLLLTVHIPLKTHSPDFRMSISLFEGPRDSPACFSDNSSIKMKMKISITDIYLNYINSLRNAWGTNSFSTTKINQSVLMYVRTYT